MRAIDLKAAMDGVIEGGMKCPNAFSRQMMVALTVMEITANDPVHDGMRVSRADVIWSNPQRLHRAVICIAPPRIRKRGLLDQLKWMFRRFARR